MGWLRNTIPIINFNCLREAGLPLRFDRSFETAIRTFMQAVDDCKNEVVQKCLRFPHVLIRYDYGVMHVSTGADGRITGLDVHCINASSQTFESETYGMMVGTTPLLVGSILREILMASANDPDRFYDILSPDVSCPTILNPSILDRAIDVGLLLSSMHFNKGYGDFNANEWPSNFHGILTESDNSKWNSTAPAYGSLMNEFLQHAILTDTQELSIDSPQFLKIFPGATLGRLSLDSESTKNNEVGSSSRDGFGRINILCDQASMEKLLPTLTLSRKGSGSNLRTSGSGSTAANQSSWKASLRAVVERGLEAVVARPPITGKVLEPSIFCPFVQLGAVTSVDHQDIDTLLSLRSLVSNYLHFRQTILR